MELVEDSGRYLLEDINKNEDNAHGVEDLLDDFILTAAQVG